MPAEGYGRRHGREHGEQFGLDGMILRINLVQSYRIKIR